MYRKRILSAGAALVLFISLMQTAPAAAQTPVPDQPSTTAPLFLPMVTGNDQAPAVEDSGKKPTAVTLTVTTLADSGPGSLRDAINQANASSLQTTIIFSVSGKIVLASTLPAITTRYLTIDGTGQSIAISGNHAVRVMLAYAAPLTLKNVSIVDGNATTVDYGLFCSGGCGGGIYTTGPLTVTNSTFSGNHARSVGGGIYINPIYGSYCFPSCGLNVYNSIFSSNSADANGAGIFNRGRASFVLNTIRESTFIDNNAGVRVAGIYNEGATMIVSNSSFSSNLGGGIYNFEGDLTVNDSTFSGNSSSYGGPVSATVLAG